MQVHVRIFESSKLEGSYVGDLLYKSLYLLTPAFHSIPLLTSSPLASTSLFSISMILFLFHRRVHLCHIVDSTCKWYHMVFVFTFLTDLETGLSPAQLAASPCLVSGCCPFQIPFSNENNWSPLLSHFMPCDVNVGKLDHFLCFSF